MDTNTVSFRNMFYSILLPLHTYTVPYEAVQLVCTCVLTCYSLTDLNTFSMVSGNISFFRSLRNIPALFNNEFK